MSMNQTCRDVLTTFTALAAASSVAAATTRSADAAPADLALSPSLGEVYQALRQPSRKTRARCRRHRANEKGASPRRRPRAGVDCRERLWIASMTRRSRDRRDAVGRTGQLSLEQPDGQAAAQSNRPKVLVGFDASGDLTCGRRSA